MQSGNVFQLGKERYKMTDAVNHPQHYGGEDNLYETINVVEAWELGFCLGNAVKYISRAGKKTADAVEDLKKARWYVDREIKRVESLREKIRNV